MENTTLQLEVTTDPPVYRSRTIDVIFASFHCASIILGISGNLLSIAVFYRRRNNDRVSAIYLTALAAADCVLCMTSVWVFITTKSGYLTNNRFSFEFQMPNVYMCKAYMFTWYLCALMSSWIIIIFSTERMLVMWWPLRMAPYLSSSKPRKMALFILFLVMIVMAGGNLRWITLRAASVKFQRCTGRLDLYTWERPIQITVLYGFGNGFPVLIVAFLNVMILLGIKKNQMDDGNKSKRSSKTDIKLLVNLLLVCLFYLIFITPKAVAYSLYYYFEATGFAGFSPQGRMTFLQFWESSLAFAYCNYATNCFIYVFSLPFYRQEVKRMFCGGGRKGVDASKTNQSSLN